jgi:hypothetical protein
MLTAGLAKDKRTGETLVLSLFLLKFRNCLLRFPPRAPKL